MTQLEPPSGQFDGPVHLYPVRVFFEDTDLSGVVYHARYLEFLERGRSDYLRLAGVRHTELAEGLRGERIVWVVRRMEIDFVKLQKTLGISAALPKPFSPNELVNCIEETLAAHSPA